jgi:hypothetical protein
VFVGDPLLPLQDGEHSLEILAELVNGNGFLGDRRRRRGEKGQLAKGA